MELFSTLALEHEVLLQIALPSLSIHMQVYTYINFVMNSIRYGGKDFNIGR
jgi:hypothetical protein